MKLRSLKVLMWMINAVIIVGILASVSLFVLKSPPPDHTRLHEQLDEIEKEAARGNAGDDERTALLKDYDAIWKVNVLNTVPPDAEGVGGPGAAKAVDGPSLETVIELVAILGDHGVFKYKKTVRDVENEVDIKANETRPVRRGDAIPGIDPVAVLKEIPEPEKVGIEYEGKMQYLEIKLEQLSFAALMEEGSSPSKETAKGPAFPGPAGQMERRGRVPGVVDESRTEGYETRKGVWMIPAAEAERVSQNAREILEEAELSSYKDPSGRSAGIRVDHVQEGSLIVDRGFESGDIIQRVNGHPVNSKSELVDWVNKNYEKYKHFRVELQRRGQRKYLSYTVQGERR